MAKRYEVTKRVNGRVTFIKKKKEGEQAKMKKQNIIDRINTLLDSYTAGDVFRLVGAITVIGMILRLLGVVR